MSLSVLYLKTIPWCLSHHPDYLTFRNSWYNPFNTPTPHDNRHPIDTSGTYLTNAGTPPPPPPSLPYRDKENTAGSMSGQSASACEDGGCGHEGKNAVAPKRPKQQRKGGQSLPVQHDRRSSNLGPTADRQHISSEPGSRSFPGSRSHPQEEGSVRVVVRVRPLSEEEEGAGGNRIVRCCNPKLLEFIPGFSTTAATSFGVGSIDGDSSAGLGTEGRRAYSFDLCAHEGFSQKEMFESCGLMPLLSAAVDGYAGLCVMPCDERQCLTIHG